MGIMGEGVGTIGHGSDELARCTTGNDRPARPALLRQAVSFEPCRYDEFLGMTAVIASQPMRRLLAVTARVARTGAPVLISGDSGTGKELIARAVHHYSVRAAKPFVDINSPAIPEHLTESGLFDLVEPAQGGTLFLDEIGELDSRNQAKLLRMLDGQACFRPGSSRKLPLDVRVVAATNLRLHEAMTDGRFRRDLFHRLNAFHLHVPPLRERVEEIAPLAAWLLRDSALTLSAESLRLLEAYSWPGNVRELRNCLVKAAFFAAGPRIEPRDLPAEIRLNANESAADQSPDGQFSLEALERQTIRRALARTGGHQQKAADLLGISRRTLIRKLRLYRSLQPTGITQARAPQAAQEKRIVA